MGMHRGRKAFGRGRRGWVHVCAASLALSLLGPVSLAPSLGASPQDELDRASARLLELEKDFELVVERYNLVRESLAAIEGRMATTELELQTLSERLGVQRAAAVDLAGELYKGGSARAMEAVLTAGSIGDVDSRLKYIGTSQKAQTRVFERLATTKDLQERKLEELEKSRAEATASRDRLDGLRTEIEGKLDRQKDEIARLNAVVERARRLRELRAARQAAAEAAARPAREVAPASGLPAASVPEPVVAPPAPAPSARADTAVRAALSQVGKPYRWGAAGPDAYDCSGLTMWAWAKAGVSLPHNSRAQYASTPRVARSDWRPGDLLFFGHPIHHVGMYIGEGRMVEAPYTGSRVRTNSAYRSDYVGAGRPGV